MRKKHLWFTWRPPLTLLVVRTPRTEHPVSQTLIEGLFLPLGAYHYLLQLSTILHAPFLSPQPDLARRHVLQKFIQAAVVSRHNQ